MTSHPQTATERFLRHGVAGGYVLWDSPEEEEQMFEMLHQFPRKWVSDMHVSSLLLEPALWEAAGRSLGWRKGDDGAKERYRYHQDGSVTLELTLELSTRLSEWQRRQLGLLDHLAAHPGDVEGYMEQIIDGKEK